MSSLPLRWPAAISYLFIAAKETGSSGRWDATGFDPARVASEHAIPEGYEVLGIYER